MEGFTLASAMTSATDLLGGAWDCVISNPLGVAYIGLACLGIGMAVFHKIKNA